MQVQVNMKGEISILWVTMVTVWQRALPGLWVKLNVVGSCTSVKDVTPPNLSLVHLKSSSVSRGKSSFRVVFPNTISCAFFEIYGVKDTTSAFIPPYQSQSTADWTSAPNGDWPLQQFLSVLLLVLSAEAVGRSNGSHFCCRWHCAALKAPLSVTVPFSCLSMALRLRPLFGVVQWVSQLLF